MPAGEMGLGQPVGWTKFLIQTAGAVGFDSRPLAPHSVNMTATDSRQSEVLDRAKLRFIA